MSILTKEKLQRPIIYEIDDLLFNIPESNFACKYYQENEDNIKEMLTVVNGITVSTPKLKELYSEYNNNISVVKNYLFKSIWECDKNKNNNEKLRILYPASANHFDAKGNGGDVDNELLSFIKKTTDKYEWIFIGGIPHELKGNKNVNYYP